MSGNNPSFYYLVDLCFLMIGCWAEYENTEIERDLCCHKNMDPLRKKEEGSKIKKGLLEYKDILPLHDPDLFISTAQTTFLVLILLRWPEMTPCGLCVLEADKRVVYSDLKNPSLAFSIYFQGLYHLQALAGGKEKGKVRRNSINKPRAEI